ncbi:MAG: putative phosphoribosyl transferase [Solirubrobacteraceae bacterium]|jgi:putative phosphoribosyl transferase|nr:putative phosphoribosyl transferase [Solirubrobacteraceae bacterium]
MAPVRPFADRADAGRRLASVLPPLEPGAVVLGLARGGVPVAHEVSAARGLPLDVLVVRKVGHPRQPEYALGAVSEDGVTLPEGLPENLVAAQLEQARAQALALRAGRGREPLRDRPVVVVDDGLATGRSMAVALATARRAGAARLVMAVPVASGPGFRELADECEAYAVALVEPPEFLAVGQFYDDFSQVDDADVAALLRRSEPQGP